MEILEENVFDELLRELEKFYVKKYNTFHNGYNQTKGGDGGGMIGKKHSDKTKRKIADASRGRKHSEETKRKMRGRKHTAEALRKMRGEKNPMYGKKHSEETKRKQSEAKTGENHPMYGKPSHNRLPEYNEGLRLFRALPANMPLGEKRKQLYHTFKNVNRHTIRKWVKKWLSKEE